MLQDLSIVAIICFSFLRGKPMLALPEGIQRAIICKDSKEVSKMEGRKRSY
jgi:hypothetical protein